MAFSRLSRISKDFLLLLVCSFLLPFTTAQWLENNIIGPTCQGHLVEYGNLPEYRSVVAECNAEPNYCRPLCIFSKLGMLNNHGSYMPARTKYLLQQLLPGRNAEKAFELSGAFQSCSASFNFNVHLSVYQGCSSYNRLLNCFRQSAIMICEGIRAQDLLREDVTLGWPTSLIPAVFRGGTVSNVYGPPAIPSANADTRVPYNTFTPISQYRQDSPSQYGGAQPQPQQSSQSYNAPMGGYNYPRPQGTIPSQQVPQGPTPQYQPNQPPQVNYQGLQQTLPQPQGNRPQLMNQYNAQQNIPQPQQVPQQQQTPSYSQQQQNLQQLPPQVNPPQNPEPAAPKPVVESPPHPQQIQQQSQSQALNPSQQQQQNQLPPQQQSQQNPIPPSLDLPPPPPQQQQQVPVQQQDEQLQEPQQQPQHINAHHPAKKAHPHHPPQPAHHKQQVMVPNNEPQMPVQPQVQQREDGPPPPPGNDGEQMPPGNPELTEPYGEGSFTFLARRREPTHHEQQQQQQDNGQEPQQNQPEA